ncbi:hypothetical protein AB0B15_16940 [Streptomyces sp. NPDC045456]|uniref:hypothetical protein n=1 Tax=unclassified Streptomyces TaxID=2593676 RepID=UPI0033E3E3C7
MLESIHQWYTTNHDFVLCSTFGGTFALISWTAGYATRTILSNIKERDTRV